MPWGRSRPFICILGRLSRLAFRAKEAGLRHIKHRTFLLDVAASSFGLSDGMFYRQALMLVEYLQQRTATNKDGAQEAAVTRSDIATAP